MRGSVIPFAAACLLALLCCQPAAAENRVPEMEIDMVLRRDGSAEITQVWTADTSEGTEFYLACRDSGYLTVTDFAVSDENGAYTFLENWDVDASFEEKMGRCGIVETGDGVELCWGISEYGARRYTVAYVLHNLAGAYSDADGFNHRFVDEMAVFPTDVALTIRMEDGVPLTDDICDIWAFGFGGDIRFEDGVICARSASPLDSGQHMTVMVRLEKGVLAPSRSVDGSFETEKERAFEGSDYQEEGTAFDFLLGTVVMLALGGLTALGFFLSAKCRRARLNRRMRRTDYFRDAPNNGNLNVTCRLGAACELCREDALLGAYLLRLISGGALEPEETGSSQVDLRLIRPPQGDAPYDDAFYTILEAAPGRTASCRPRSWSGFVTRTAVPWPALRTPAREMPTGRWPGAAVSKGRRAKA